LCFRLLPGDPISLVLRNSRLTPEQIESFKKRFGLDKPLWMQYLIYLANAFRGELGISIYYKASVSSILIEKFVNSLILLIPSTIVAIALGIVIGALSAWKRRSAVSKSVMYLSLVLYSLPIY
jgi:peptide/nickel transport system permease protein